jgi:ABC-2 type transport system permease protein
MSEVFGAIFRTLSQVSSFIGKEAVEVIRRPGALFSLILGPFLIMGLFGLGYSGQYRPLAAVIVVPPGSNLPTDANFYQQTAGQSLQVVQVTSDESAARELLQRQQIDLVVVVPADAEQQLKSGEQSVLRVAYNQLDPVRDNYVRFAVQQAVDKLNQAIIAAAVAQGEQYMVQTAGEPAVTPISPQVVAAPTRVDLQNLAPLQPSVVAYFAPAVLALVLQHMAVTLTALAMVRERLSGAMDLFRVAPVGSLEVLIGKYLAYAFFCLAVAAVVSLLLVFGLRVPLVSSPGAVTMVVVLLSFASLGLGLLISTVVDSERQAVQLAMLVLLASVFFSGFVLPLDQFLPPMRYVAYLLPVTHAIQLLQDFMLRGYSNAGWEVMALAAIGVVLFGATSLTLRRNLAPN